MSDYRIEAASKEDWAERALRAETENARLREAMNSAIDSLRRSPDHNTETIQAVTHLFLALETPEHRLITAAKQARDIAKGTRDE